MMKCLLHNELLSFGTGADEVDTSVEFADVDAVDADTAFNIHHSLTHDVVDHDTSFLAEGDIELVDSRIGIDAHACDVTHRLFNAVVSYEEFRQVVGKGLVEVVISSYVATGADDEGIRLAVHLASNHESVARDGGLWVDEFRK